MAQDSSNSNFIERMRPPILLAIRSASGSAIRDRKCARVPFSSINILRTSGFASMATKDTGISPLISRDRKPVGMNQGFFEVGKDAQSLIFQLRSLGVGKESGYVEEICRSFE